MSAVAILAKSQRTKNYSSATFLANAGIRTLIDDEHAIAQGKVMVIDGRRVITGASIHQAGEEKNAENLLVNDDPGGGEEVTLNWRTHERHAGDVRETNGAPKRG